MKFLKLVLGLALILFIGHLVNTWGLENQESQYVYIETVYPNGLSSITVKKVPKSICGKQLESNAKEALAKCENCTLEEKMCTSELGRDFDGIFENKELSFSYISLDYKYPERHIMLGLPDDGFNKLCNFMKKRHPKAICIQ